MIQTRPDGWKPTTKRTPCRFPDQAAAPAPPRPKRTRAAKARPKTPVRKPKKAFSRAEERSVVEWIEVASEPQTTEELSILSDVPLTATHAVLRHLKEQGVIRQRKIDGRRVWVRGDE